MSEFNQANVIIIEEKENALHFHGARFAYLVYLFFF